jgi:hypothetical protein
MQQLPLPLSEADCHSGRYSLGSLSLTKQAARQEKSRLNATGPMRGCYRGRTVKERPMPLSGAAGVMQAMK